MAFVRLSSDHSVYTRGSTAIVVYVDDLLLFDISEDIIEQVKTELKGKFKMTDLGKANMFLGMRIQLDILESGEWNYTISQEHYIKRILDEYSIHYGAYLPLPASGYLKKNSDEGESTDIKRYQRAIGSLMYVMLATRPDIAFPISHVAQFASNPSKEHWEAVLHILRYLHYTKQRKLHLNNPLLEDFATHGPSTVNQVFGFSDADWAGDSTDRRSISAYGFYFYRGLISWSAKKQPIVATSTLESEYIAAAHAAKQATWLRQFSSELGHPSLPVKLFMDNQGCIKVSTNAEDHKRTKHFDIRFHYLREQVAQNKIIPYYISTKRMAVDTLTKPLPLVKFTVGLGLLGVLNSEVEN